MKELNKDKEDEENKEDSDQVSNEEEDNDDDWLTDDEEEYEDESCMIFEHENQHLLPLKGEEFLVKEFLGNQ